MRLSQDGLFDRPVTNPYFRSMARQVRLCPRCGHKTRLAGTLNPDAAYEACDDCGLFTTLVAPEWASDKSQPKPTFTVVEGGRTDQPTG
ncbi:hypothetical protein [Olsenella urininfantis]|uniref:hypothetical protein n=1 Tax=Olsenella urininfantis TaxID=1871033 RepID=UPI000986F18C|nr:hypothetical protein [Olsenella urininfantis]